MEELKPCKCGSVDIHEEVMSDNKSHIACQVCGFEIITDYPEWSFELWNTRAKEVIMSEPLSKVLGLKKDEVYGGTFADNQIQIGKNMTIDELDQRSPDAKELTTIIVNFSWKMRDEELHFKDMAQEIINKINVWVVKKG